MTKFTSNGFEKFGALASFYPAKADIPESVNVDSLLLPELFDNEYDLRSDLSIDSSSSFSFDSSEYLNWAMGKKNQHFIAEPLRDSLIHKVRATWSHSESPQSSLLSSDEMSELIPFEESKPRSPKIMFDGDEEKYLAEYAYQDMIAAKLGWRQPSAFTDNFLYVEEIAHDIPGDYYPKQTSIWKNSHDNSIQNKGSLGYDEEILGIHSKSNFVGINPNANETSPNPNNRKNCSRKCVVVRCFDDSRGNRDTKVNNIPRCLHAKKNSKNKKVKSTENDAQRVFLGGLPAGMTERMLRQHLAALGYKVLRRPKIVHSFAPEVWMKTVDQAQDLIRKGVVMIEGREVDVRPYNSLTKLSELKKLPKVGKRSAFIGGLPPRTTTKNVIDVLSEMGMKVINYPPIKHGFARQVIFDTVSQARTLIQMKKFEIHGKLVDVRPFVNQNRWKSKQKSIRM